MSCKVERWKNRDTCLHDFGYIVSVKTHQNTALGGGENFNQSKTNQIFNDFNLNSNNKLSKTYFNLHIIILFHIVYPSDCFKWFSFSNVMLYEWMTF